MQFLPPEVVICTNLFAFMDGYNIYGHFIQINKTLNLRFSTSNFLTAFTVWMINQVKTISYDFQLFVL